MTCALMTVFGWPTPMRLTPESGWMSLLRVLDLGSVLKGGRPQLHQAF